MDISSVGSNPFRQYVSAYKEKIETRAEDNDDAGNIVSGSVNNVVNSSLSGTEKIIDFTYGLLGIDQIEKDTQEVSPSEEQGGGLYRVGQYIKAAGTVGTFISFFV